MENETIKFRVTRGDLRKYSYFNSPVCAMGVALRRHLGHDDNVHVMEFNAHIDGKSYRLRNKDRRRARERSLTGFGNRQPWRGILFGGFTVVLSR